jgi:hypothetical protein
MSVPPNAVTFHLFRAFKVVPVRRLLPPPLLASAFTHLLTFGSRTMALPISGSGIRMIELTTMQALTTSLFFHHPHALREENPRVKENPPAKQMGQKREKKRKKRIYLNVF